MGIFNKVNKVVKEAFFGSVTAYVGRGIVIFVTAEAGTSIGGV